MLNSASALITMDLIRYFRPQLSDRQVVRTGRWTTAALLLVAVAWAPQLIRFPSLWQYLQAVLAYAVPPAVAIFGIGMFWRGATADGATATFLLGSLCGMLLFLSNSVMGWTHFHFLYAAPLLTALDAGILIGVSRLQPAATTALRDATMWRRGRYRAPAARLAATPLWQDYRCLAAVLLALTAALVIAFR
jgi:SSS family solute:Na+ symporter